MSKQFEFLALDLEVSKHFSITVVGCYRPPSADSSALPSLFQLFSDLDAKELVVLGDLNWNWLHSSTDAFKNYCDALNLFQIVDSPTRPNLKCPEKSSLIDLILTNVPHKYSTASVFANDISDHCVIATVRNTKIPKSKPGIITKRDMKHFSEQGFLHDLNNLECEQINLIPDLEIAWEFFYNSFSVIVDKHAPLKSYRVKGRDNAWFSLLSNMLNWHGQKLEKQIYIQIGYILDDCVTHALLQSEKLKLSISLYKLQII